MLRGDALAMGGLVGQHDDQAGDAGGAGIAWSNGKRWRRVQSAPFQPCTVGFPTVNRTRSA